MKLVILKTSTETGDPILQESCLSICLRVITVRGAVAEAVTHRAGSQITWCSLFVFRCLVLFVLLSRLGNLFSCLDVETRHFLSCIQWTTLAMRTSKSSSPPGYSNATFQTSSCVLLKESPIDGPSPETEPIQFKALCDAFEI